VVPKHFIKKCQEIYIKKTNNLL